MLLDSTTNNNDLTKSDSHYFQKLNVLFKISSLCWWKTSFRKHSMWWIRLRDLNQYFSIGYLTSGIYEYIYVQIEYLHCITNTKWCIFCTNRRICDTSRVLQLLLCVSYIPYFLYYNDHFENTQKISFSYSLNFSNTKIIGTNWSNWSVTELFSSIQFVGCSRVFVFFILHL